MYTGHVIEQGSWSEFESIMFVNLIRFVERELSNVQSKDSLTLTNFHCSLVRYICAPYCSIKLPLDAEIGPKYQKQITEN